MQDRVLKRGDKPCYIFCIFGFLLLEFCWTQRIKNCRNVRKSFKIKHARVAELADALDLGSSG